MVAGEMMRQHEQADVLKAQTDKMAARNEAIEGGDMTASIVSKLDARLGGGDDVGKFASEQLKDGESVLAAVAELSAYLDSPAGLRRVDEPGAAKAIVAKYLPGIKENADLGSDSNAAKLAKAMEAELRAGVTMKTFGPDGRPDGTKPFDLSDAKTADINETTAAEVATEARNQKNASDAAFQEAGGAAAMREQVEAAAALGKAVTDGQNVLRGIYGRDVAGSFPDYSRVLGELTRGAVLDAKGKVVQPSLRESYPQHAGAIDGAAAEMRSARARIIAANEAAARANKAVK